MAYTTIREILTMRITGGRSYLVIKRIQTRSDSKGASLSRREQ